MAKRGYKFQEFVAHAASVSCLTIGRKSRRLVLTGGEDHRVNLWAVGKPTSLLSLSGHTSSVESVTFDSAEVLVISGASTGTIKLWDLEEAKIIRTLNGHRANCNAVEFHPFGEFFASGSSDADLKIWDVRKKGCIHTYKGHTRGVSTFKFTPDGRWIVSGGMDNVVKVWDLTAGKLLHEFKFHDGQIRCIDFHPLEFLLATGSSDRTVNFWDLETFELIGSAGPEATGVRSMTFHPDGRTLFCGLEDSLKVFSWEPIVCHDAIDVGWSTLGDLTIHEGKLLGCSYYRNSVSVWVADIGLIAPYGVGISPESNDIMDQKLGLRDNLSVERMGTSKKSDATLLTVPHDCDTTEIRNIYVDTSDIKKMTPKRVGSFSMTKVKDRLDNSEVRNPSSPKRSPDRELHGRTNSQVGSRQFNLPVVVPRNNPNTETINLKRVSTITERSSPMLHKPTHTRRQSSSKYETGELTVGADAGPFNSKTSALESESEPSFHFSFFGKDKPFDAGNNNHPCSRSVTVPEKVERTASPDVPLSSRRENSLETSNINKGMESLKIVKGVQPGRTKSLVERWEQREKIHASESLTTNAPTNIVPEVQTSSQTLDAQPQTSGNELPYANDENVIEGLIQNHDMLLSSLRSRLTKLQVVRHFWQRNDVKGGINAVGKLPDHSVVLFPLIKAINVQADVVSVLMEKMEIVNLDLFSCLLPLITGLLNSQIERHASVSLEILLKLVAVFGPVIHSTISATPTIGVDLQAEKRRECCSQCYMQLQKIKQVLPSVIRRGGLLAKSAQELHLVLQES
ncbi:hypothetical protein Syun_027302 [Stephania yunnanensis]|uniref:Katanin p80 WD40 repeat-containing subunit B1 homolog n=1 Tax=Stephania yunnanensis TaxID=152371 RepID=A0AAP0EFE0_9MAGN